MSTLLDKYCEKDDIVFGTVQYEVYEIPANEEWEIHVFGADTFGQNCEVHLDYSTDGVTYTNLRILHISKFCAGETHFAGFPLTYSTGFVRFGYKNYDMGFDKIAGVEIGAWINGKWNVV